MAAEDLLTIRHVAAALNLSEARVHQLIAEGQLDCAPLPDGRKRHAPGSARVAAASVERLRLERQESALAAATAREQARTRRRSGDRTATVHPAAAADLDVAAARAAALELKVRLDAVREQVRKERDRADKVLAVAAQLVDLLRDASSSADDLDDVAEGFSSALTQLLAPGTAPK